MQVQIDQSIYLAPSMLLGPEFRCMRVATSDRCGNQLVLLHRRLVVDRFLEQR